MRASISTVSKINFTFTQLISAGLFLGYNSSNWNSNSTYFLLGKRLGINLFNLNYTYLALKKFIFVLKQLFLKNSKVWVVSGNFRLFSLLSFANTFRKSGIFKIDK